MIGPAIAAAAVVGTGAAAYAGWPRWSADLRYGATRKIDSSADLRADLSALGEGAPAFVARGVGRAAVGTATGLALAVLAWSLLGPVSVAAVPIGAALAALSTRWSLARAAAAARAEMRLATLELAELVSLAIGAGLGVPAALARAAAVVTGASGERLRVVIESSATPWSALESLGEAVRVSELADFARSLAIGVEQQARTREVLLGWSQAARAARLEESEAAAGATTEAMTGPLALVAFGFLLTVGVPAVLELLSGVSGVHL